LRQFRARLLNFTQILLISSQPFALLVHPNQSKQER
jgi:hypothetical protein